MGKPSLSLRPLPASLALLCAGVGAGVLLAFLTFTLVPVLVAVGLTAALLVGALLCGWSGIEALAALERWMETDPRFRR
ncbi:glypican [Cyanobium sp. Morenito 9A2]|uniref:glypican n=1 Tax=Cyanobium sp. Morenito 9A2 TaxID=2823718 RepID=UPI0020CC734A|nr:glypican [Cyanobium sp. Morenito 9A2]MCP9849885.1 glypican [Cyanobium sp. Morenito 9A2]